MIRNEKKTPSDEEELKEQEVQPTDENEKKETLNEKSAQAEKELKEQIEEEDDFKQKYLHLLADSENARKRLQKDRDQIIQLSIRSLLLDFLHPIDHMENALKYTDQASGEVKNWAQGFLMILAQFKDVLSENGVKSFNSVGMPFDPHIHDAVEMIETLDYPPGTVVEENVKGYTIGGKPLRPARVIVSKEPEALSEETQDLEEKK
jgi:molecular chaperone GrpE